MVIETWGLTNSWSSNYEWDQIPWDWGMEAPDPIFVRQCKHKDALVHGMY